MIEAAKSAGIRPVQPDQRNPCGDHPIRMAVQRRMNQHIAGPGECTPNVARFLEAARQHYRRIGAQMAMPRQAEAAG